MLKVFENVTPGSVLQRNPDIRLGEAVIRKEAKKTGRSGALLQRSAVTRLVG